MVDFPVGNVTSEWLSKKRGLRVDALRSKTGQFAHVGGDHPVEIDMQAVCARHGGIKVGFQLRVARRWLEKVIIRQGVDMIRKIGQ